jgi:hypothetical protein
VHRLRVVLTGEIEDLLLAYRQAAQLDDLADPEVLVVAGQLLFACSSCFRWISRWAQRGSEAIS